MADDSWTPPETYWVIDLHGSRYRIPAGFAEYIQRVLTEAKVGPKQICHGRDIYDEPLVIFADKIEGMFLCTARSRRRVTEHEARLEADAALAEDESDDSEAWRRSLKEDDDD